VLGVALGLGEGELSVRTLLHYFNLPVLVFRFDPTAAAAGVVASLAAGALGAFSAVRRVVRLPPAEAMQPEYEAIVAAGLVLQVDCPDLASGRANSEFARLALSDWLDVAHMHVDALNHALRSCPPDQVRLHLCWGNYAGPHHRDVPLADILDVVLHARVGAISFEAANPRHAHEWAVFQDRPLPPGVILMPGVIESCSLYVEHPDLVAQRLQRFVDVVGFENVIAGTDCGFGTFVGSSAIHPGIVWAKLQSLVEGAAKVRP